MRQLLCITNPAEDKLGMLGAFAEGLGWDP